MLLACVLCFAPINSHIYAIENESTQLTDEPIKLSAEQLQEKESDAIIKYNTLLQAWAPAPELVSDYQMNFPDIYGGAYIDEEKNLVIQVTKLTKETLEFFSGIIDISDVIFEVVQCSMNEIKEVRETIDKELISDKTQSFDGFLGTGISFRNNSVKVYVTESNEFLTEKIEQFKNIEIDFVSDISAQVEMPQTGVAELDTTEVATSLQPGSELLATAADNPLIARTPRSMGYWVYDSNDNLGIITTPHNTIVTGDYIYYNNMIVGTAGTTYYSGNVDAVFVKCTNPNIEPSRGVDGWDFVLNSVTSILLPEGATVYGKGSVSGCTMGVVEDISFTTYSGIRDCVLTSCSGDSGDSGGIMAGGGTSATRYIAGIINAKTASGKVCYVKAINIHNALGVRIY